MPTPFEILFDPVSRFIIGLYALLIIWEALFPAKELPAVKGWYFRGVLAFIIYFYLSFYLPILINPWMEQYRLLDSTALGTLTGATIGIILYEAGMYVLHRAMHKSELLWRNFHQLHHKAERLEGCGAFYFSPLDMYGFTFISSFCFAFIIGLSPEAISIMLLVTNFFSIFQHANIRTPQWLGYIIQRPESYSHHHMPEIPQINFSDLPLFDILFGTFFNPPHFPSESGLCNCGSASFSERLAMNEVTTP